MNLTSFISNRDVREKFSEAVTVPRRATKVPILAKSLSKDPSLVGTAFDYAFRFFLKRLYSDAVETQWICEKVLVPRKWGEYEPGSLLQSAIRDKYAEVVRVPGGTPVPNGWDFSGEQDDWEEHTKYPDDSFIEKIHSIAEKQVAEAREHYEQYKTSGVTDTEFFRSMQNIAKLDFVYRTGKLFHDIESSDDNVTEDLRNLFVLLDESKFLGHKYCILNPDLGGAVPAIHSADADVIFDDSIIELKTTAKNSLAKGFFHQLIGYFILLNVDEKQRYNEMIKVQEIGIYFSRYAEFITFPLRDLIDDQGIDLLSEFVKNYKWKRRKF